MQFEGGFTFLDDDLDGIGDNIDNCLNVINTNQVDTNQDGFGNACDGDTNNDCIINFLDVGLFANVFQHSDPDNDFNSDGVVNFLDYPTIVNSIFSSPGPSARVACP